MCRGWSDEDILVSLIALLFTFTPPFAFFYLNLFVAIREIADANGIVALLGEYRTRCLFSKTFVLREAVQFKVRLMLTGELLLFLSHCICLLAVFFFFF